MRSYFLFFFRVVEPTPFVHLARAGIDLAEFALVPVVRCHCSFTNAVQGDCKARVGSNFLEGMPDSVTFLFSIFHTG